LAKTNIQMKMGIIIFIVLICSCAKKGQQNLPDNNVTVKGVVWNEKRYNNSNQEYWKPGIIFNKAINASGTAVITWYFNAGWINGNPTNHYSHKLNFNVTDSNNGYFEFSDWQVDYTMQADSIKIKSFNLTSGNYNVTLIN
jgi:hypothetical protein